MKKYRLVTGWYPSRKTAEKILNKVKGNCNKAFIDEEDDCYVVVLYESDDYDEIDDNWSKFMRMKIYCGIVPAQ